MDTKGYSALEGYPEDVRFTFEQDVFPAELEEIHQRRGRRPSEPLPPWPSTRHELVGLCFSGGGIRSASFNLGVVQALHRRGVFRHVDYLSTVSGGGYLGSAISSLMHRGGDEFPFPHLQRKDEPPALTHLRNNSNYLAPDGPLDYLRMLMVIVRGILINFLILSPLPMLLAVLTAYLDRRKLGAEHLEPGDVLVLTPWALGFFLVYVFISPVLTRLFSLRSGVEGVRPPGKDDRLRARDLFEKSFAIGALVVGVALFIDLQPLLIRGFHALGNTSSRDLWGGLLAVASAIASVHARKSTTSAGVSRVRGKVALIAAGLLGPLLPLLMYLYFASWLAYEPRLPGEVAQLLERTGIAAAVELIRPDFIAPQAWLAGSLIVLAALLLLLYCGFFVDVNDHSGHGFWRDRLSSAFLVGRDLNNQLGPEDDLPLSSLAKKSSDPARPSSRAPYHLLNTSLNLQASRLYSIRGRKADFFVFSKRFIGSMKTGYCPTEAIEQLTPHVNLGTAMAISSAAAAPNMGSFTISGLTFLMTMLNVRMGFWAPNPRRLCEAEGLSRGQVAAWLERARRRSRLGRWWDTLKWRPGMRHLFREMAGDLDAEGRNVNVSDGGHLENLGAYELLRRRCKYLIVGDGEADPERRLGALAALIRYARIDLGVEIDIDLDDLRLQPGTQLSRQHCALGVIRYPAQDGREAETGLLLYVKASLNGDEDGLITEYARRSPDFPHETTADQFFDEAQLEAYRSLGYHIIDTTLSEAIEHTPACGCPDHTAGPEPEAEFLCARDLVKMFRALKVQLSPNLAAERFVELQEELGLTEKKLGTRELASYYAELYPELTYAAAASHLQAEPRPASEDEQRQLLLAVNAQLQLMESVYLELGFKQARLRDHESNAGWMSLFKRWSRSERFRWGYAVSLATFGRGFRLFCDDVLGLELSVSWAHRTGSGGLEHLPLQSLLQVGEADQLWIANLEVGGQKVTPEVPVAYVLLGREPSGQLYLKEHQLFRGFESVDLYELLLHALAEHARRLSAGEPLRIRPPRREDILPAYRDAVDIEELERWFWSDAAATTAAPVALRAGSVK